MKLQSYHAAERVNDLRQVSRSEKRPKSDPLSTHNSAACESLFE